MSISVLKNEGFCQLWGALAKKNSKKNFKRAPSAARTDPFEPLFRKKKFEKKLFLAKISLRKSPKSTTPSLSVDFLESSVPSATWASTARKVFSSREC